MMLVFHGSDDHGMVRCLVDVYGHLQLLLVVVALVDHVLGRIRVVKRVRRVVRLGARFVGLDDGSKAVAVGHVLDAAVDSVRVRETVRATLGVVLVADLVPVLRVAPGVLDLVAERVRLRFVVKLLCRNVGWNDAMAEVPRLDSDDDAQGNRQQRC